MLFRSCDGILHIKENIIQNISLPAIFLPDAMPRPQPCARKSSRAGQPGGKAAPPVARISLLR
jgi:hypothetical protein